MPDPIRPSLDRVAVRVVDVYAYRLGERGPEFLLLRRAPGRVYAGQWRCVGGKIEGGETAWQAALRELREETGRRPVRAWTVPSVNAFYEWQTDRLNLIPAFAAELDADPVLDSLPRSGGAEHDAFRWLPADQAVPLLAWPEQQRLLRLVARLLSSALPPELSLPV